MDCLLAKLLEMTLNDAKTHFDRITVFPVICFENVLKNEEETDTTTNLMHPLLTNHHSVFSTMRIMSHPSWFLPSVAANTLWILLFQHLSTPALSDCGCYLAESSIPNAGLGMYVGK